jgi:hypothetical protein
MLLHNSSHMLHQLIKVSSLTTANSKLSSSNNSSSNNSKLHISSSDNRLLTISLRVPHIRRS